MGVGSHFSNSVRESILREAEMFVKKILQKLFQAENTANVKTVSHNLAK
jgi:hypothetical protein